MSLKLWVQLELPCATGVLFFAISATLCDWYYPVSLAVSCVTLMLLMLCVIAFAHVLAMPDVIAFAHVICGALYHCLCPHYFHVLCHCLYPCHWAVTCVITFAHIIVMSCVIAFVCLWQCPVSFMFPRAMSVVLHYWCCSVIVPLVISCFISVVLYHWFHIALYQRCCHVSLMLLCVIDLFCVSVLLCFICLHNVISVPLCQWCMLCGIGVVMCHLFALSLVCYVSFICHVFDAVLCY